VLRAQRCSFRAHFHSSYSHESAFRGKTIKTMDPGCRAFSCDERKGKQHTCAHTPAHTFTYTHMHTRFHFFLCRFLTPFRCCLSLGPFNLIVAHPACPAVSPFRAGRTTQSCSLYTAQGAIDYQRGEQFHVSSVTRGSHGVSIPSAAINSSNGAVQEEQG
jgi:hypothetical protein